MLFGAIAVLLTGQISPINALKSININVTLFLFSMFVVGVALDEILRLKPSSSKGKYLIKAAVATTFGPGILLDTNVTKVEF